MPRILFATSVLCSLGLAGLGAAALADAPLSSNAKGLAPPPSPTTEIVDRLQAITSRSAKPAAAAPKFAFTGNLTLEHPASFDEATMGMPAVTLADASKTFVVLADPDTAWISTHLGEYSACGKAGCAKEEPDSWLRVTALFERSAGVWQPTAWSMSESIRGTSQQDALEDGVVPDKLTRDAGGADEVVKLFESTVADPKAFAATLSTRKEVVLFGSELAERYAGPKAKAQLAAWTFSFVVRDGVRAGMSKSGNIAWVAANVDGKSAKRPKDKGIPYRMFVLYEKTPAGWKVAQLQFSTAV